MKASGIAAGAPHNLLLAHSMGCAAKLGALVRLNTENASCKFIEIWPRIQLYTMIIKKTLSFPSYYDSACNMQHTLRSCLVNCEWQPDRTQDTRSLVVRSILDVYRKKKAPSSCNKKDWEASLAHASTKLHWLLWDHLHQEYDDTSTTRQHLWGAQLQW